MPPADATVTDQTRLVGPGPDDRSVKTADGQVLRPPADWACLPPGDAHLTRLVKAGGPCWTVQEKRGRKTFSRGVWAPVARIEAARTEVERLRDSEGYQRRLSAGRRRREVAETQYAGDFRRSVLDFLAFAPPWQELGERLATAVAEHATPVGSGTVARTKRIPIEERAEAAVIAWMRHRTTSYDDMAVRRVKGERRRVRRELAARSRAVLAPYRDPAGRPPEDCPLRRALDRV